MASSSLLRRLAVSVVAGLSATVVAVSLAPAVSAQPTIDQVSTTLDSLSRRNEQLTEFYNKASDDVKAKQAQSAKAQLAAAQAALAFDSSRQQLRSTLAEQFKSAGMSSTAAMLTSTSRQNYLDQLSALQLLAGRRAAIAAQLKLAKAAAATAQKTALSLLAAATGKQKALAAQRTKLAADQAKYTKLLASLNAAQRAAFVAASNPTPAPAVTQVAVSQYKTAAPSGAAAIAIKFALAQLGKPYVFAASGPDAYDCSGLTMAAWGAAGVSLPHFAESQYNYGTHVSRDQLRPGDLVFFYQPIGHVGIYLGNGLMIHAPTTGDVVRIVPLSEFDGDYVGATRL